jgi:hypothetical protein
MGCGSSNSCTVKLAADAVAELRASGPSALASEVDALNSAFKEKRWTIRHTERFEALVTNNEREYRRVAGLSVENWVTKR